MKKIMLVDGNSILFRAYYATAATGNFMTNKDGIPTNAIFGFINMFQKLLERNPDYVYVAFDHARKTFRNELMEDYKGTRKETPDELKVQFGIIREYLGAANIPYSELEGYEADDLIGTLATVSNTQGLEVEIITGDKDMLQLVNDHITVLRTTKGVSEMANMDINGVIEKFGVRPDQIRDLLGLMGDSADNIPGVKGIGEKTAVKLLTQYGSIEGINENAEGIKGKLGEKVRDGRDMAILSKKIATILTDVPMDTDLEHYAYLPYDHDVLASFYRKYDLNTFLRRMPSKEVEEVKELKIEITDHFLPIQEDSSVIVVNYDDNYHRSIVLGYAFYNKHQSFFMDYEHARVDTDLKEYLGDESKKKIGFDIKKSILCSRWNGIEINGFDQDVLLASYVINPNIKDEIKYVADLYDYQGNLSYSEDIFGKGAKKHIPDNDQLAKYAIENAKAIYELHPVLTTKLKEISCEDLYTLELKVSNILGEMEYTGTKLDLNVLKELEVEFEQRSKQLEREIHELAGHTFNISSTKQLGEVLFDEMQLPYRGKKNKTGYSTAVDVLEKIVNVHPIIQKILDYRMLTKLDSTYVKGLQQRIFNDGKIHTIYNQALTQTGRLSSVDPNLQNISVKTEEGKLIRKAFVPSFDYLLSYDYSQIELRVLASLANVTNLIEAFNEGRDIHAHTASTIFNVPIEEVTSSQRRFAKTVNFGIVYGMSDYGLSEQLGISVSEAKDFIESYYASYPEIKTYMNAQIEFCKENGYVETILHRRRYIPEINEAAFQRRELGKRLAMNSPIQGSGADIIKLAMVKVDELMKANHVKSKMILQVHDELIFDVYADEVELMMKLVKEGMESAYNMSVKLKVEGNYAKDWCSLK